MSDENNKDWYDPNGWEDCSKSEIREVIKWCDEKGHSEHEILELIRRIVNAKPREEESKPS
ncbi:MAG: hypothetical protein K6G83_14360 [Lachnospiraceae bacterium]|nr:hypothetical protein [Lachnospiraceae bacterium]